MGKNQSPDPPFISHYAIIQGEMGIFLTFSVFELQRGYLYQNRVEFRQKVIGAGLNLFLGHLHYFSGDIWTFPLLSDTYASAPIAERAIIIRCLTGRRQPKHKSCIWYLSSGIQLVLIATLDSNLGIAMNRRWYDYVPVHRPSIRPTEVYLCILEYSNQTECCCTQDCFLYIPIPITLPHVPTRPCICM